MNTGSLMFKQLPGILTKNYMTRKYTTRKTVVFSANNKKRDWWGLCFLSLAFRHQEISVTSQHDGFFNRPVSRAAHQVIKHTHTHTHTHVSLCVDFAFCPRQLEPWKAVTSGSVRRHYHRVTPSDGHLAQHTHITRCSLTHMYTHGWTTVNHFLNPKQI